MITPLRARLAHRIKHHSATLTRLGLFLTIRDAKSIQPEQDFLGTSKSRSANLDTRNRPVFPHDFELRSWFGLFFSGRRKQAPRTPSFRFVLIFDLGAIRTHLSLPLQYAFRRLTAASSADHPETKTMPALCEAKEFIWNSCSRMDGTATA
jgi:hypothetical protein